MSEGIVQKGVEIDYINAMLDVSQQTVPVDIIEDTLYQMFSVSDFKVAVLRSEVHAIVNASEVETIDDVLFHASDEYTIVDVRCLIKPSTGIIDSNRFVLLGKNLALTCEEDLGEETIDKDTVCWRTEESKRKWLAGTIKSKNIILLDIGSLQ
jgi:hypothetical protein